MITMQTLRPRLIALLVIPVVLVAATCVTDVRQRGPGGPWAIDVLNGGDQPVTGFVFATVFDATGRQIAFGTVRTCPGIIPPHGIGAAEARLLRSSVAAPVHPLRATFQSVSRAEPATRQTSDGLQTHVTDWHAEEHFVMLEVTNTSLIALGDVTVCATLRGPSHELLDVGNTPLFPTTLRPGETQTVPVYFNNTPTGNIEVFASGSSDCCETERIDNSSFEAQAMTISETGFGRVLRIAGEITNSTGEDLQGARIFAYLDGAPGQRVEGVVACTTGIIGRGAKAPVTFVLPLPGDVARPRLLVAGIEAKRGEEMFPLAAHAIERALGSTEDGLYAVGVQADIFRPQPRTGIVGTPCATLRNSEGDVVGTSLLNSGFNGRATDGKVTGLGTAIEPVASVDVAAYGRILPPPPPPSRIAGPD